MDPWRMLAALKRCPFTLLMLMALVAAGVYGRSHVGPLDADVHQQVSSSVRQLLSGHLHRLFTSVLFTAGGGRFYASLCMFAGAVGWVELTYGTRCAVLTFFGVHLMTQLALVGIVLPLIVSESRHGALLMDARDVGPSAGYYGCLGLAVAGLPAGKRTAIVLAIFGVLLVRTIWSTMHIPEQGRTMSADLAHLAAFPLGWLLYRRTEWTAGHHR